jgi:Tfp pilus assembly protein PilN
MMHIDKKSFKFLYILVSCAIIALVIIISWDIILLHKVRLKCNEIIIKEQKIHAINARLSDQDATKIITKIKQLQNYSLTTAALLHKLALLVPPNLYLSEITKDKLYLILKGSSSSYADINKFINKIRNSNWLKDPMLSEVTVNNDINQFIMQFVIQCAL